MRLRFGIETKDHNVVPIFPPKHFVGTQPRVGEQAGYEATRNGRRPEATAQFVDVFGNVSDFARGTRFSTAYPIKLHLANCVCQQRLIAAENVTRL